MSQDAGRSCRRCLGKRTPLCWARGLPPGSPGGCVQASSVLYPFLMPCVEPPDKAADSFMWRLQSEPIRTEWH